MSPDAAADRVLQHALSRSPTLGPTRLVCVDGPSGSGKTSVAVAIARRHPAQVVALDELLHGWHGLVEHPGTVHRLLAPLAAGQPGWWRRYDWHTGRLAEWHVVRPGGLLVLDGVGAGGRDWAAWTTTSVWVAAGRARRMARGIARDGVLMEEHWRAWAVEEDALHVRERTAARADVRIDST